MEKAITTALMIIAGVVCMIFVFNSVYPMVNHSSQAMVSMAEQVDERMKSRINIVHAASSANRTSVYLWIKNVGTQRIVSVEESDLFFGQVGPPKAVGMFKVCVLEERKRANAHLPIRMWG